MGHKLVEQDRAATTSTEKTALKFGSFYNQSTEQMF